MGEEKLKRSIELGVGHLKIGVSSTLCKYMLLPYLKEFIKRNPLCDKVRVILYGSLALTGKGHLTDYIIEKTLMTI